MIRPLLALFTRALREDARSKFPVIIRCSAAVFLLLLVWMNETSFAINTAPGLQLLMMTAMVNFFGLTITGLGTFCSSITEEKEDDTLGLLSMTRLNPLSILLGKSTARLVSGLFFLMVQLPFTMLCATLGGVSFGQILHVNGVLAAYLFFLCNLGLLASVLSRRTARAIAMTTLILTVLFVLPFILFFATGGWIRGMGGSAGLLDAITAWLISANPFFDILSSLLPFRAFPIGADSIFPQLAGGVLAFLAAWAAYDRYCSAALATAAPARKRGKTSRQGFPRPWRLAIAWKDFQFSTGGWKGAALRTVLYGAIIFGITIFASLTNPSLSLQDVASTISGTAIMIFSVEFGMAAARIFGNERKNKTLGSLWLLPRSAGSLIWEKLAGTLPAFVPPMVYYALGSALRAVTRLHDLPLSANAGTTVSSGVFFAISQYAFFGVLVAYLTLVVRRGALLLGILAIFVGNLVAQLLMVRLIFSPRNFALANNDWQSAINTFYLAIAATLIAASMILAFLIPGRLAACAS